MSRLFKCLYSLFWLISITAHSKNLSHHYQDVYQCKHILTIRIKIKTFSKLKHHATPLPTLREIHILAKTDLWKTHRIEEGWHDEICHPLYHTNRWWTHTFYIMISVQNTLIDFTSIATLRQIDLLDMRRKKQSTSPVNPVGTYWR